MTTLKRNTTPETVTELVRKDFNVTIDRGTAKEILDAHRRGALLWTPAHLVTVDQSRIKIVPGKRLS